MKTYTGSRTIDGIRVLVDGQVLDERRDLKTYTRNGFEWTYVGGEPMQLALALLPIIWVTALRRLSTASPSAIRRATWAMGLLHGLSRT